MNTPSTPSEDPLEKLLRRTPTPVADDGFSARVLAALPAPATKPRRAPNRRVIACGLGALAGLVWALAQSGPPQASDLAFVASTAEFLIVPIARVLNEPTLLLAVVIILVSLAFAYAREIAGKLGLTQL